MLIFINVLASNCASNSIIALYVINILLHYSRYLFHMSREWNGYLLRARYFHVDYSGILNAPPKGFRFPLCFSYQETQANTPDNSSKYKRSQCVFGLPILHEFVIFFPIILVFYCFPFILMLYFIAHYVVLASTQINLCGHKTYIQ